QGFCRLLVPEGGFLRERWRLVEGSQVVGVLPHVAEHPRCGIWILERGNVRVGKDASSRRYLGPSHPTRQHGFARKSMRILLEPFRRERRLGLVLGGKDRQNPVGMLVRARRVLGRAVRFGLGAAEDSDGLSR